MLKAKEVIEKINEDFKKQRVKQIKAEALQIMRTSGNPGVRLSDFTVNQAKQVIKEDILRMLKLK
jgi:hypothetical protein